MVPRLARCGVLEASQIITGVLCIEALTGFMVRYKSLVEALGNTPWCRFSASTIKKALHLLLEQGVIGKERFTQKRVFYYLAKPLEDLIIEKTVIKLDLRGSGTKPARHIIEMYVSNNGGIPVSYIPLVIMGDTARDTEMLRLRVSAGGRSVYKWIYDDTPHTKRVILRLEKPLAPGETMILRTEYLWEEIGGYCDYISCRHTLGLEFVLNLPAYLAEEVSVVEYDPEEPLEKIDITARGVFVKRVESRKATVSWRGPGPQPFRPVRIQWGSRLL